LNFTKYLLSFLFLLFIGLLIASCDLIGPQQTTENPIITYTVSGGFWGGISTKLNVNQNGIATLETAYPPLELQLSQDEYSNLLSYFDNFNELPDTFKNQCTDGLIFKIEYKGNDYSKNITIDQCTLNSQSKSNSIVSKINSIILALDSLAKRIYETKAPWIGLISDFSIDSDVYGIGAPITLRYRISNPTSVEKTIYFRHQDQFWFRVARFNFPSFNYLYPVLKPSDSSAPTKIILKPGESKDINYVWDQLVHSQAADTALGIGYFRIIMNLFTGDFSTKEIWFEVLDRNVPITGMIIPDPNGENSNSPTYTFNLLVRNWTTTSVTLHFPSSQTISVELFDLDKPTPGPLIYSGPIVTDSVSSEITLSPGATKTFAYTANKSDFIPWYMWTYARIRLLSSDFEFMRDGQLRIFSYR